MERRAITKSSSKYSGVSQPWRWRLRSILSEWLACYSSAYTFLAELNAEHSTQLWSGLRAQETAQCTVHNTRNKVATWVDLNVDCRLQSVVTSPCTTLHWTRAFPVRLLLLFLNILLVFIMCQKNCFSEDLLSFLQDWFRSKFIHSGPNINFKKL